MYIYLKYFYHVKTKNTKKMKKNNKKRLYIKELLKLSNKFKNLIFN